MAPHNPTKPKYGPDFSVGAPRTIQYLGRDLGKTEQTAQSTESQNTSFFPEEQQNHYKQLALNMLTKTCDNLDIHNGDKPIPEPNWRPNPLWFGPGSNPKPLFPYPILKVQLPTQPNQTLASNLDLYIADLSSKQNQNKTKPTPQPAKKTPNKTNLAKTDLHHGLPQPGLGPDNVDLLGLHKEVIALKEPTLITDYPSPTNPKVRYGGPIYLTLRSKNLNRLAFLVVLELGENPKGRLMIRDTMWNFLKMRRVMKRQLGFN